MYSAPTFALAGRGGRDWLKECLHKSRLVFEIKARALRNGTFKSNLPWFSIPDAAIYLPLVQVAELEKAAADAPADQKQDAEDALKLAKMVQEQAKSAAAYAPMAERFQVRNPQSVLVLRHVHFLRVNCCQSFNPP
jgi:hypothetical protein